MDLIIDPRWGFWRRPSENVRRRASRGRRLNRGEMEGVPTYGKAIVLVGTTYGKLSRT